MKNFQYILCVKKWIGFNTYSSRVINTTINNYPHSKQLFDFMIDQLNKVYLRHVHIFTQYNNKEVYI